MTDRWKRVSGVCEEVGSILEGVKHEVSRHAHADRAREPLPDGPQQAILTDESSYEQMVQGVSFILWVWAEREYDRNRESEVVL